MPASVDESHSADESQSADEGAPHIVGTKTFTLDDAFLDERLARVLAWWRGEREPEGVEVELTRRCVYVVSLSLSLPYFPPLLDADGEFEMQDVRVPRGLRVAREEGAGGDGALRSADAVVGIFPDTGGGRA